MPETDFQAQLAALRRNFVDQLPQRLADMQAGLQRWLGDRSAENLAIFHRVAHNLTGAGATYGFPQLSDVARTLEMEIKALQQAGAPVDEPLLQRYVAAVADAIAVVQQQPAPTIPAPTSTPAPLAPTAERLIYLLEGDAELRELLSRQLEHFGYQVRGYSAAEELSQAVRACRPAAIITDITLPQGESAGIEAIAELQRRVIELPPVIFVSSRDDFETRLESVRAGGHAFFLKPVRIEDLIDVVDHLCLRQRDDEPLRVLVIDDSIEQAQRHAVLLEGAGMRTQVATEPTTVMEALTSFGPELILLDMYMPGCSGMELAKVIRQQPAYVGIPIVFLSAEVDRRRQLEAMRLGGDDFLTKSIHDDDLVASVIIRAERYRTLRSLMTRDGLTGLLNHSALMDRLRNEVRRNARHHHPLSFAMIDIDHFKKVNDTYGHAVGDRVIKTLARLLRERLRAVDVIGRYGGEEFAVIMPDTTIDAAARVLDDLRDHFALLDHNSGAGIFHVTFSCGLAALPPVTDAAQLIEIADQRLYAAKHAGRNRTIST